ncbi:hypothetical protein BJX61DRAFT_539667 [Aspergillus egyptiacus]|nr:hypothetical protein BJX61DRAFT_539667 [Aspergillus egyptiacus]
MSKQVVNREQLLASADFQSDFLDLDANLPYDISNQSHLSGMLLDMEEPKFAALPTFLQDVVSSPETYDVPGAIIRDLPVPLPAAKAAAIAYYKSRPVVRTLDWHTDEQGQPIRKALQGYHLHGKFFAALIQTRGKVSETRCKRCALGKGPWQSCVVEKDLSGTKTTSEICANCQIDRIYTCSLKPVASTESDDSSYREEDAESDDDEPIRPWKRRLRTPVTETEEKAKHGTKRNHQPENTPQIPSNGLPPNEGVTAMATSVSARSNPEASKEHSSKSASSRGETVVKFPLPPDAFDDLPFLKRAFRDMVSHCDKVAKRIKRLEEEEQKKNQTINPWDLL